MGVFACLELPSEICEAIHLLQNVVKLLESSLRQIDNEQKNLLTVNANAESADLKHEG